MAMFCPTCGSRRPDDDVDLARRRVWCRACQVEHRFDLVPGGGAPRAGPSVAGRPVPHNWRLRRHGRFWLLEWPWRRGGELWAAALMLVLLVYAGVGAMHLIDEPATRRGFGQLAWISALALGAIFGAGLLLSIRDLLGKTRLVIGRRRIVARSGPLALGTARRVSLNRRTRFVAILHPRPQVLAIKGSRRVPIGSGLRDGADATFVGHALGELVRSAA